MPGKITYADAQGTVIYYNQAWIQYTGLSLERLINNGWDKTIYPEDLVDLKILWQHSIKTGNELDTEMRILNNEGEYKWHNIKSYSR